VAARPERRKRGKVTDEEIKMLVAEAEHHGTIESDERRMIAGVMRLGDRAVRAVMTPRTEVDWINLEADEATIRKLLMETQHSRLPAGEGSRRRHGRRRPDPRTAGGAAGRQAARPRKHVRKAAPIVHDQADALDVLANAEGGRRAVALVHDEYGHFEGIVTPADILEAITGVFRSDLDEDDEPRRPARRRLLAAGRLHAGRRDGRPARHRPAGKPRLRDASPASCCRMLHHLPSTGEAVEAQGWRFEVVDLDGRRIDKVTKCRGGVKEVCPTR
jgi:putative hemolysin